MAMETNSGLADAFKTATHDQDKTCAPAETVRRFMRRLEEVDLHILDEVVRIDNGRLDIPVYMSYCGPDARELTDTRKQMGKGATPDQARASAVMELAERFSLFSFRQDTARFRHGRLSDMGEEGIPFDLIAASVHDSGADAAGRVLFESVPMRWCRARNLTDDRPLWIPFDWFFMINEFNGSSAGNCREEALCQGICEVVERHVSARVSRERIPVPVIDPASVTDPAAREMLEKYRRNGIQVVLSDFTLDTGIASVGVIAWDPATFPEKSEIVWTAGTAPDPQKAVSRSLSEAAQLGGDFNSGANYLASGLPKFTRVSDADFLTKAERCPVTSLPDISDNNIRVEVMRAVSAMADLGMAVITVDVTHPRLGVPACYTVIPGARFRERAAASSVPLFCAKMVAENLPPAQAGRWLRQAEKTLPGSYFLPFYLGYLAVGMADYETAVHHLNRALERDPAAEDRTSIYLYLGVCLKETERYGEALAVLQQAVALDPDRTELHNLMGFCHFKRKAHREAIASFEAVLRLNPGSAIDYANIASNYRELGELEQAIAYYETALSIDPSIEFARDNLERLRKRVSGV